MLWVEYASSGDWREGFDDRATVRSIPSADRLAPRVASDIREGLGTDFALVESSRPLAPSIFFYFLDSQIIYFQPYVHLRVARNDHDGLSTLEIIFVEVVFPENLPEGPIVLLWVGRA